MNLETLTDVIKASPAIQIQSKMTLLQRRAWNVLLANAYNELLDKDIHTVSLAELSAKLGFGEGNQAYLKEMLRSLRSCEVEWNLLNKDKKQVWGVASLLASAEIENGICTYGFAPHLRRKLYNPRVYAKLNLRLQNRFSSKYALVLWEICFDYFDTYRDQGETPFISLEVFKELMGLEKDEYPLFKELNRNVIKPAIKEINTLTNYHVEVEQKRIGRRIGELKFRITRVAHLQLPDAVFPDIETLPSVAIDLIQADIDRKMALKIAKQAWDFITPEQLPPPGTYPDFLDYIKEKIEMSLNATEVKNRAGFIVEAIRENYQDPSVQKAREVRAEKVREKKLEDLTAEFNIKRNNIIRQAVQADPQLVDAAAEKIQSYIVRQRLNEHPTPLAAYQKGGLVTAEINHILAEELCKDLIEPVNTTYEDKIARILVKSRAPRGG